MVHIHPFLTQRRESPLQLLYHKLIRSDDGERREAMCVLWSAGNDRPSLSIA